MGNTLGRKIVSGTVWAMVDKLGTMGIQFVVNIVLARLLMPADFGSIGMLAIFISVSQTLVDGGFGSALIQKKEPTQEDYSTIFYWNLFFSIGLYGILFLSAPYIATFFKLPILCDVLRVLGLILIVNALVIVQNNRLRKQLAFKTIALINVSSHLIAAVIAIGLAYKGFGVWSLVAMQLLYGGFQNCMLWGIVRWHPTLQFSLGALKRLFSFGSYLLASNLLQEICRNLQGIIIGRKFSAAQMGYYAQARKLDDVCCYALPNVLVQVLFPVYSQFQNDKQQLQKLLGLSVRVISYFIFPLVLLLVLLAEPLILFLYGDKWIPAIPYFQVLCFGGLFICLQNTNYFAVAAVGKSHALFIWSFYKWGVHLCLLLIGSIWGMYGILWGMVISNINIYAVNAFCAYRYVGYSPWRQVRDFVPVLLLSSLSFGGAYLLQARFPEMHFALTAVAFVGIYLMLTLIFRLRVISDMVRIKTSLIK